MLLQITNNCNLSCIHCLNNCQEEGDSKNMSEATLKEVIAFCKKHRILTLLVSGGEPTIHPQWSKFLGLLTKELPDMLITVASNGYFLRDEKEIDKMRRFLQKPNTGLQVTSTKKWYSTYEDIQSKKALIQSFPNTTLDEDFDLHIMDLGRARELPDNEIHPTDHPSCFKSAIMAKQMRNTKDWIHAMEMHGQFCHPTITYDGWVSMSESTLCGRICRLRDFTFDKAQAFQPCGSCRNYARFKERLSSGNIKELQIAAIMQIKP